MSTETTKTCPHCGRFVAANGICETCQAGAQVGTFAGAVGLLFGSTATPPAAAPRSKSLLDEAREILLRGG